MFLSSVKSEFIFEIHLEIPTISELLSLRLCQIYKYLGIIYTDPIEAFKFS